MAKNVKITEDGSTKIIENAARIRTSLEGGGTCDWIPKDDVPLQELTVTEDGVYRPEEGYYGFSKVTANGVGNATEGDLIEKTVTKNGTYNIADESGSPYGYSKIVVNVDTSEDDGGGSGGGGSSPVVGKDEDGNDTMAETDDDGNVVMTALPTEIKVIIPPTKLEYKRYESINYSGISVYAYIPKAVHWLGTTTTAVSEGSSNNTVSIGGNSVTASVGDGVLYAPDRTGTNDVQLVWDGSKWVKPTNYSAEKAIRIPFEELIFPMKRASYTDNKSDEELRIMVSHSDIIPNEIKYIENELNVVCSCETINRDEYPAYIISGGDITPSMPISEYEVGSYYRGGFVENINREFLKDFGIFDSGTTITFNTMYNIAFQGYIAIINNTIIFASDAQNYVTVIESYPVSVGYRYNALPTRSTTLYYDYLPKYVLFPGSGYITLTGSINMATNTTTYKASVQYTQDNKTVYYSTVSKSSKLDIETTSYVEYRPYPIYAERESVGYRGMSQVTPNIVAFENNIDSDISEAQIAWTLVYGDHYKKATPITLPVQWKRPGDGKILETTFTAWMKDDGGDNNTSGGNTRPGNQNIPVPQ